MPDQADREGRTALGVVTATGETPIFCPGDSVLISTRNPIGHYRLPTYLRGKAGRVESAIKPAAVDNEEEGYGRNSGSKRHYYRVSILMTEIWPQYDASPSDRLLIEIFETWLTRI